MAILLLCMVSALEIHKLLNENITKDFLEGEFQAVKYFPLYFSNYLELDHFHLFLLQLNSKTNIISDMKKIQFGRLDIVRSSLPDNFLIALVYFVVSHDNYLVKIL